MRFPRPLRLEKIQSVESQLFVLRRFQLPAFPLVWHYHPEVEVTLIRRGRGLRYVGGSVERYEEGDLCLLNAHLPHSWSSERKTGPVESSVIQFLPETAADFWALRELRKIGRLLARGGGGWHVRGKARERSIALFDALERLPLLSSRRAVLFLELLSGLAEATGLRPIQPAGATRGPVLRGKNEILLQSTLSYVEANSTREIVHTEAARRVRMSPAAFCRFFKRRMGKTFGQHVNEVRIARVCGELIDTDQGIIEIAFACGYNNLSHFNRQFTTLMGCTPREYRRRTTSLASDG